MTSSRSEKDILDCLDSVLAGIKWRGPPSDTSHLSSPAHMTFFKELGNQEKITSQRIVNRALQHAKQVNGFLRVCSIGCEDGTLDRTILEGLKEVKVQYVGLEVDEQACEAAMDKLAGVFPNIEVSTVVVDYEDMNEEELKKLQLKSFDIIWMINCTYYAVALAPLIQGATHLLKPSGEMLIISSSMQSFEELIMRFWSHQRCHQLHTTENVVKVLNDLSLTHQIFKEPITFDLTKHLKDEFKSPASQLVLDYLVFCRLSDYPPEVRGLVVEFLQTIAEITETSDRVVSSISDMIAVSKYQ